MQIHQDARQAVLAEHLASLVNSPGSRTRIACDPPILSAMLSLATSPKAALSRGCIEPGHFTASAFVLCPQRTRLLLVRHRKLKMWLQPGGHIEPTDADPVAASRRELAEETGLRDVVLEESFFDLDLHQIPDWGDTKAHLHHDIRALFLASAEKVVGASDVSEARWFSLVELSSSERALPYGLDTDKSVRRVARFLSLAL